MPSLKLCGPGAPNGVQKLNPHSPGLHRKRVLSDSNAERGGSKRRTAGGKDTRRLTQPRYPKTAHHRFNPPDPYLSLPLIASLSLAISFWVFRSHPASSGLPHPWKPWRHTLPPALDPHRSGNSASSDRLPHSAPCATLPLEARACAIPDQRPRRHRRTDARHGTRR